MHEAANLPSAVMAVTLTTTALESGLVALALAMLVALLVVRSKRAHDQKLRKAASMGYYDPDVARYGYGSPAVPAEPPSISTGAAGSQLRGPRPGQSHQAERRRSATGTGVDFGSHAPSTRPVRCPAFP